MITPATQSYTQCNKHEFKQNTSGFFYCIKCGIQASKFKDELRLNVLNDCSYMPKKDIKEFLEKLTDMESISCWGNTPDQRLAISTYVGEWKKLKTKEWKL